MRFPGPPSPVPARAPRQAPELRALEVACADVDVVGGPIVDRDGMPDIAGTLRSIDRRLVAAGYHPIAPAWWPALEARSRVCVVRKGRRAGGSVSYERLAVATALASPSPGSGDVGVFAILSATRRQASDRLARCKRVLDTLQLPGGFDATASEIRFPHGTAIRVTTASVTDAVSSTLIGAFLDEMALWQVDGANPAADIFSLIQPSISTIPWGRIHLVSAPYTTRDPHAVFYDRAEREGWFRAHIPTWEGNPTLTEQQCRELAESDDEFERAYAARPLDTVADFMFPPALLEAACCPEASR